MKRGHWGRGGAATLVAVVSAQPGCGAVSEDSAVGAAGGGTPPTRQPGTPGDGGGTVVLGGTGGTATVCTAGSDALAAQSVPFPSGSPRVFYSWTTAEQVAELRAGGPLFSRTERDGLGRGYAFTALATFATSSETPAGELARVIGEELFVNARYGWTNTWGTHLGWPGESYGGSLIRIELAAEAWIVQFDGYNLMVLDAEGNEVALEAALATPERIGALYFLRGESAGGPTCGTFFGGSNGYREFVLGNPAMVARWSVTTSEILAQLDADIAAIDELAASLAGCEVPAYTESWNAEVVCGWTYQWSEPGYESALAMPSELYYPTPERLLALVASLRNARFVVDPFEDPPPPIGP